jgi:two-component system phosphate regulon response regulator PhoB
MQTQKPTILLVDDDSDLRETLADGLEASGYVVIQAEGILNIMKQLPTMKPAAIIVDLVLMGDSGATLLRYVKLHPQLKGIKVIMMSGFEHGEKTAQLWGADLFLQKPITIARLLEVLNAAGIAAGGIRA